MKKNILFKFNYEIELFTKNLSFDLSQNKKYTYLIASDKPFFEFDKLKSFFIENEKTDFAKKELNILLNNCNVLLKLCKDFESLDKINTGFNVHFIDKKNLREFKGNFSLNKKLVYHTGKSLISIDEDGFLKTYQSKKISIYNYNYQTLKSTVKELKFMTLNLLDKESLSDRIKNLFSFIDFLHSNLENFKSYDKTIERLHYLDKQRNTLKPEKNFKDKLKYDEVHSELEQKFKIIYDNIIQKIKSKTIEFDVCNWNDKNSFWSYNISEIRMLKKNFTNEDARIILKQMQKYIEFREKTDCNYFQFFFFDNMDKTLKELFNYFKVTDYNEFESFETKTIKVDSIEEALNIFVKGQSKFNSNLDKNLPETEKQPLQTKTKKPEEIENNHPEFNPNYWNKECYNLFKYLFDNYYLESTKRTKRQITNIWFFLYEQDKIKYNLKATKDDYKTFIKNNYKIELKNFDKATQKYSTEYGTMNDHRINYEDIF